MAELHEINDNAVMISPSTNDENSHFSVRTGDDDDEDEDRRADHMNQEEEPRQQEELFDMDESSHPDHQSGQAQPSGQSNKIKIVLSSLMANNLNSNRISNNHVVNNNNNLDDSSNLESANKLDSLILNHDHNPESMVNNHQQQMSCVDLLHQEYELPDIQFEVKPQLKGLKFDKSLVPVKRGLENSGLCSIM